MKKIINLVLFSVITLASISCSDDDNEQPTVEKIAIRLTNSATYGSVLTDTEGKALYFFSKDTKDNSVCDGNCESLWPIFYAENLTIDNGLELADFSVITRPDGQKQTTYKGWPLYYFVNDTNAGDIKGDGVNDVWYVAKPDYSLMYASSQLLGNDGLNYLEDYTVGDGTTNYIVDISGRTMYTFVKDTNDTNNFTAPDFSNNGIWPIVEITLDKIPSILKASDFGIIDVHGKTQLTYKGWPLYYFGQDSQRGDNKGISVPAPGIWPIANTNTIVAQ